MKSADIAFMTMVREDHLMFKKWVKYYEKFVLSRRQLHVFLHGEDQELEALAQGCSVTVLPYSGKDVKFEDLRKELFFGISRALLGYYRYVIILDADEFLVVNPTLGKTFPDYLEELSFDGVAISPVGFDIIQNRKIETTPVDLNKPIIGQRMFGRLDGIYSKPCIYNKPYFGNGNQHILLGEPWIINPDIFLFHFRFFDVDYGTEASRRRMNAAQQYSARETGTWADRLHRFKRAMSYVEDNEIQLLENKHLTDFVESQITNYDLRKRRQISWKTAISGPYQLPEHFKGIV